MESNEKLNSLVERYQADHSDETFRQIYVIVSRNWRKLDTVAKSVRASEAEILASYEDALMRCVDTYDGRGDFINYLNRCIWRERRGIYRKKKRLNQYELYAKPLDDEEDAATSFEIADEFNLEEHVITKKEADQRQLIDFLLSEGDEITKAIVKTFLNHPKPTPTAIGRELGIHHSTIIRKLERLAGKFDYKQYGDYRDYLLAL